MASKGKKYAKPKKSKKDPVEDAEEVLDVEKDTYLDDRDIEELNADIQEEEKERKESLRPQSKGKEKKEKKPSSKRRKDIEEDDQADYELPNQVELPKNLYPEFVPDLENQRRQDEKEYNNIADRVYLREETLGTQGNPEAIIRNLRLAENYYFSHEPAEPIISDYNDSLDIIFEAAQTFSIETPEGFEPKQRVEFINIQYEPSMTSKTTRAGTEHIPLFPNQCRRLDLSYLLTQTAVLREIIGNGEPQDRDRIEVVRLPLMLGSKECWLSPERVSRAERPQKDECPHDPFGYFIVDGKMRSLIGQEKLSIDRSILIDRGVKRGTDYGVEVQMLCKTPTKALAHHVFYQKDVAKKTGQFEVMAFVQNLTSPKASNVLSLLRAILIAQRSVIEIEDVSSIDLLTESLSEHIAELTKGAVDTLVRNFNAYLRITLDKASDIREDDEFILAFVKEFSLPLLPRKEKKKVEKKKPKKGRKGLSRRKREEQEEEKEEEEIIEGAEPDFRALWNYLMENLFPQVTFDTYRELFKSRDINGELSEEELTNLTIIATQKAKEHLLLHNVFRLFLYKESPATEKDDRDHFGNKRVEFSGSLMANFYLKELQKAKREILKLFEATIEKKGSTKLVEMVRLFFQVSSKTPGVMRSSTTTKGKAQNITASMYSSFTGEYWGSSGRKSTVKGVSHILEIESLASMISGIRKVKSKGESARRTINPHLFHASQGGLFCPFENSDDQNCLCVNEEVLMENNSYKKIGDIKNGDIVVTIHETTGEIGTSPVHNFFIRNVKRDEKVREIITLNGKKLKATDDHPFFTQRGRIEAQNLVDGDRLGIVPHLIPVSPVVDRYLIIDRNIFIESMKRVGIHKSLRDLHLEQLEAINLFPLYSDDKRIPIISRLYGFTLGDGCIILFNSHENQIAPRVTFDFGTERDAEEYNQDIIALGFDYKKAKYKISEIIEKGTGRIAVHHTWSISARPCFAALLIALGINPGRKTTTITAPIPLWIKNGSMLVKREFLAGFQGADGCKISWISRKNSKFGKLSIASTRQQRVLEVIDSLAEFMNQFKQLLIEFDVECSDVRVSDQGKFMMATLYISNFRENIVNYMDRIGYRYATTKRRHSEFVTEYLRYLVFASNSTKLLISHVLNMRESGKMRKQIAEELNMSVFEIRSILCGQNTGNCPKWVKTFTEWSSSVNRVGDTIYIPIISNDPIRGVQRVADFTTDSDAHSFVTASGFAVGNCGITKYLAISADVSRELPSEYVIRELYKRFVQNHITILAPSEWDQSEENIWPLFINGIPVGYTTEDALEIAREWRREAQENQRGLAGISVYVRRRMIPGFNQRELHIESTPNRMARPLHICRPVDPTRQDSPMMLAIDLESIRLTNEAKERDPEASSIDLWKASWNDLVYKYHVIEFVDKREEEVYSQVTAWFPWELENTKGIRYTHCEVNPFFTLGYNTESMPFSPNEQGTRTGYGANQFKHVVGVPTSIYAARFDTTLKVLHHPQRPITTTATYKAARFYELPTGTNARVAILTGKSNIEDAIVVNEASMQRGMFNSTTFVTVKVMNAAGEFDRPNIPDKRLPGKPRQEAHFGTRVRRVNVPEVQTGSYEHLNEAHPTKEELERAEEIEEKTGVRPKLSTHPAGIVPVGTKVQVEDILATKVRPEARGVKEFEQKLKHTRAGRVDAIQMVSGRTGTGVKIRLAFPNMPEVGDKLASIESQKGLIGELRREIDMPFSTTGEIPDILMNPHGFPSRQTFSYIMEGLYGKAVLAPPKVATEPRSALKGAQPYNRTYQLSEIDEGYIRPNLTMLWMEQINSPDLNRVRNLYAREHPEIYQRKTVNTDTIVSFRLENIDKRLRERLIENGETEIDHLLYINKKRLYKGITEIPPIELAKLKSIFSQEIVNLISDRADRIIEYIQQVSEQDLIDFSSDIIAIFYGNKVFEYIGDLPKQTQLSYNAQIRSGILEYGDTQFLIDEWDNNRIGYIGSGIDNEEQLGYVSWEDLRNSDIEGADILVDEILSTIPQRGEKMSKTQDRIEELFDEYMKTDEYVKELTAGGNLVKKIPLLYLKKNDKSLYRRLKGRYVESYVPLVDIISLRDKSLIATERLERLRKDRERTEYVKVNARNATAFNKTLESEDIEEYLKSIGWKDGGEEVLMDGNTGEQLRCKIWFTVAYYHVMTQMASEKIQARSNSGAISAMTRRPVGGRRNAGGGKHEEMNTFSVLGHGAVNILKARLNEESVLMKVVQCRNCNIPCVRGTFDEAECRFCHATGNFVRATLPFPSLKMKALITTIGINMSFLGDVSIRDKRTQETDDRRVIALEQEIKEDFFEEQEEEELEDVLDFQ